MTQRLTKRCRAPRRRDAYPCKNRTSEPGTTCPKHHGLERIPEGERGPRYIDGYHDHLIFRLKSRVHVHPAPGRWAGELHEEAKERYTRVDSLLEDQLTEHWVQGFEEQASNLLAPAALRKATSAHACRRCDRLALAAQFALETNEIPQPPPCVAMLLAVSTGMPCIGIEDLLIDGFEAAADEEVSPVAAARALQLVGIQACRRRGRPTQDCYCARAVVRHEGERQLMRILDRGTSDWESLGDLGLAA